MDVGALILADPVQPDPSVRILRISGLPPISIIVIFNQEVYPSKEPKALFPGTMYDARSTQRSTNEDRETRSPGNIGVLGHERYLSITLCLLIMY